MTRPGAAAVALLYLSTAHANAPAGAPAISGIGIEGDHPAIVFDHLRDQLQPYNIPDAAVSAWKSADGSVNLMIPSFENYRMRGPTLHELTIDPHEVFSSEAAAQFVPEGDYDYNDWLIAPYTRDGRAVYALTHMEWYGCLLAGECTDPRSGTDYTAPSWVTTLTELVSNDGGATFAPEGAGAAHVVSNEFGYIWRHTEALAALLYVTAVRHGNFDQTGMLAHTRIVGEGGYFYAVGQIVVRDFAHADYRTGLAPVIATGLVEIRTQDIAQPHGWEIWVAGSEWMPIARASVTATYGRDPHTPVGTKANFGLFYAETNISLGQIAFDARSRLYILVGADFSRKGLFYATTRSLAAPHWTRLRPIRRSGGGSDAFLYDPRADRNDPSAIPPCTTYAKGLQPLNYPSLLDATSPGLNFDSLDANPELFYVVNPAAYPGSCAGSNLARDLYRVPLEIDYAPAE